MPRLNVLQNTLAAGCLVAMGVLAGIAYAEIRARTVIPHGPLDSFEWVALPEFGGREAIIYRSPDGRRVAAAFEESGTATFTYPFDEFLVVTAGTATIAVHGGETIHLRKGDVAYIREGTKVDFQFSEDFADVACLMADHEVKWR
jgi:uncharacterized cupin superfamily protein